jgi:hypothetical protein
MLTRATTIVLVCGLAAPALAQHVLFDQSYLATTPTLPCIPAGSQNSQLQTGNLLIGLGAVAGSNQRVADDFVVPAGSGGWTVSGATLFAYMGASPPPSPSPITAAYVRVWDGRPGDAGSAVIFGDLTTNRLASSDFSGIYRITAACSLARPIYRVEVAFPPLLLAEAHTYWIEWTFTGSAAYTGPFVPPATITGERNIPNCNARYFNGSTWISIVDSDPPNPDPNYPPLPQGLPFMVRGTAVSAPACYANCDGSSVAPVLNVLDFSCFLNKFAAGDTYANCDGSTVTPVLNVLDFSCFLNKFAAGCSAP